MKTVTFGMYNSYEDLGLILNKKTIGAASPKTQTVDIPGADGELDYTEYFGSIKYSNRTITLDFSTITSPSGYLELYSRLQKLLNGSNMEIRFSDDPDFHYIGRVTVNDWASNARVGKVVINVNAKPYKMKNAVTVVSAAVDSETAVNCPNLMKEAIPTISTTKEVTVKFGTYQRTFKGKITDDDIVLKAGQNVLTFIPTTESALIAVEYEEGEL